MTEQRRWTLEERFNQEKDWKISPRLFGDCGADINDFELHNYNYLLDHARSVQDIVNGLRELSPLVDDALEVAEKMREADFYEFKLALAYERGHIDYEVSKIPDRYFPLVIPKRFFNAVHLADKYLAPLGAMLIRIMETENTRCGVHETLV